MSAMMDENRVLVFDTTLRDGEQSPGCSMNPQEKLEMAHALRELGVDVIEAGFPIASPGDFESVLQIAREVDGPIIAALARCNKADIEKAATAVKPSKNGRVHVFLATSSIHRQFKLKMSREEIIRRAVEGISLARSLCEDVEFSPEDASRTELDFLAEVCEKAIEAGARTLNIPDTVGYAVPSHYADIMRYLKKNVRGIEKAILSVHCHDDLGMAVANSLAALQAGARQVECTINGIGERAGNCALEEIVMAMRTRGDFFDLKTNINSKLLYPTSRKLTTITGMQVQRNKAIVGQNAFAHESGIHQDGMLKERSTYEIMKPEDVGISKTELVLGKHSGRHALKQRIVDLGFHIDDDKLTQVFEKFKILADRKKEVYDGDIEAIVESIIHTGPGKVWTLETFTCNSGTGTIPSAAVALWHADGSIHRDAAIGDGPVDAVFAAMERITRMPLKVIDFHIRSVTIGGDAQGEASIEAEHEGRKISGRAVSTDILEASALAYLQVVNRIASRQIQERLKPTDTDSVA
jgi:2-isopropylmalate synthase